MSDQILFEIVLPGLTFLVFFYIVAEVIGRSKHIGKWWTFFLMFGFITGIIALISSPSAKKKPTTGKWIYFPFALLFFVFASSLFYRSKDEMNLPNIFAFIGLLSTALYLFQLSKGKVINSNPRFYLKALIRNRTINDQDIKTQPKSTTLNVIEGNLRNLRREGLISESEFIEKLKKNQVETSSLELNSKLENSIEYVQLKNLYTFKLLSEDEFNHKVEILRSRIKSIKPASINYRIVDGYSEGLAIAINDELDYGFVNEEGEIVIDFIFEFGENFKNGSAKVRKDRVFKKIDYSGNFI